MDCVDFYQKVVTDPKLIKKKQSTFHDLSTLSIDMQFNMKQSIGVREFLKNYLFNQKLFYMTQANLQKLKKKYELKNFELCVFYCFIKDDEEENKENDLKTKVHSVFIVNDKQPILVLFNPFQHSFYKYNFDIN